MKKSQRQEIILELIDRYDISRQEDLIRLLGERGVHATQATVSRDIRELKLLKGTGVGGVHKYTLPSRKQHVLPKFNSSLTESIVKIDAAENLIVIKTYPGMAQAVASAVDSLNMHDILGCVAGDDAIIVVTRGEESSVQISQRIRELMKSF